MVSCTSCGARVLPHARVHVEVTFGATTRGGTAKLAGQRISLSACERCWPKLYRRLDECLRPKWFSDGP